MADSTKTAPGVIHVPELIQTAPRQVIDRATLPPVVYVQPSVSPGQQTFQFTTTQLIIGAIILFLLVKK